MGRKKSVNAESVNEAVRRYFKMHGITHTEVAQRLGYSSVSSVSNQLSFGVFGKKKAERWAREFGFSVDFLISGRGRLTVRRSGYQKLVRENETLRAIVISQKKIIDDLKKKLEGSEDRK